MTADEKSSANNITGTETTVNLISLATHAPCPLDSVKVAVPTPMALTLKVWILVAPAGKGRVKLALTAPWGTATFGSVVVTVTLASAVAFSRWGMVTAMVLVVWPVMTERSDGAAVIQGKTFSILTLSNLALTESPSALA